MFVGSSNISTPTLLLVTRIFTEMEASEIEFMAEKERIEIIPNFSHATMHLIQACFQYAGHTLLRFASIGGCGAI